MTLNSKSSKGNKSKNMKTLAILAGSCLVSTILIQTPASAMIGRLGNAVVKGTKTLSNVMLRNPTVTRGDIYKRLQFHPEGARVSALKAKLTSSNSPTFVSQKADINPGNQRVTSLVARFNNLSGNSDGWSGPLQAKMINID